MSSGGFKCKVCGRYKARNKDGICQDCYRYLHDGGTINELPPPGKLSYDSRGCMVCHICGRAYKYLNEHISRVHKMTPAEYIEKFNLPEITVLSVKDRKKIKPQKQQVEPCKYSITINNNNTVRFDELPNGEWFLSSNNLYQKHIVWDNPQTKQNAICIAPGGHMYFTEFMSYTLVQRVDEVHFIVNVNTNATEHITLVSNINTDKEANN